MSRQRVIIIENDALLLGMYRRQLSSRYDVMQARHAQQAIDLLDEHGADAIVTDVMVGSNNGIEIIHELRSYDDWAQIPIVILSSLPERSFGTLPWQRYNVSSFLFKPQTSPRQLLYAVSDAVAGYGA